jgi:hypothetical protein
MVVYRTEIILQKRTWPFLENWAFLFWILCKKPETKLINAQRELLGQAPDVRRLQNRTDCHAAIGALGTVDFRGYFPVEVTDRTIYSPNGEIGSLEKAAECPIGILPLFRESLDPLHVPFKVHISDRLSGGDSSPVPRVRSSTVRTVNQRPPSWQPTTEIGPEEIESATFNLTFNGAGES